MFDIFVWKEKRHRESIIKIVGNYNFFISINQLIVAALLFSWSYFFVFCVFLCAVEHMQKEWGYLAESISTDPSASAARYCSHFFIYLELCMFFIYLVLCMYYINFVFVFPTYWNLILHLCHCYLLSVLTILQCKEPWKKSGKPPTGMVFLISYSKHKVFIQTIHSNLKHKDDVTYHMRFCVVF